MLKGPLSLRALIALALIAAAAIAGTTAALAASSTPAGGAFRVFGVSSGQGNGGTILLTGAIGDHGKSKTVNKNGAPNSNGSYVKLTLSRGSLMLNITKLNRSIDKAFGKAVPNATNCSVAVSATATIPFVSGTGSYTGVSGSAHITLAYGAIFPKYTSGSKAGQCNFSNNAVPAASQQIVTGTGSVRF